MSLAGGSNSNCCDSIGSGVLYSSLGIPGSGMPNVIDRHCMQQNPDITAQKWLNGFEKAPNNAKKEVNGSSKGFEGDGNGELPTPSVVLYDKKLDFSVRSNRPVGCGFVNLGNTCFLSSTLQCLCHMPPWFNYIISDHHLNSCKMNRSDCLVCMFQRLLKNAMRHHGSSFAPREIVEKLKQICSHMQRGRQEDAHEFLLSLLNGMQSSLLHGLQRLDTYSQETTVLCQIFGGYLRSRITCRLCRWASSTYEHFFNISLDIKNAKSVLGALSQFTKSEVLDGENAYKCDRCRRLTPAEKMYTIYKAPNVLIIQLKRYSLEEKGHSKLSHHIFFTDTLDMTPFMSTATSSLDHLYRLQCVLVHVGASINSGHYFSYVCGMNNKWFEMNDERVREVPFYDVKSAQAYMLFFVRKSNEHLQKPYSSSNQNSDKSHSSKTPEFVQGRSRTEATNSVLFHNGNQSSALSSGIKQKPTFDPGNDPTSAGKQSSSNFIRDKQLRIGCAYGSKNTSVENGSVNGSYVNGLGVENSRESKDSASSKCGISSSTSSISGFIPLHARNGGSKLSSPVQRDKVIFKIVRPQGRWNGNSNSNSAASATVSRAPSISPRTVTTSASQNSGVKLVAYDDESSDQDSDVVAEDQKLAMDQSAIMDCSIYSKSCVLLSGVPENVLNIQTTHFATCNVVKEVNCEIKCDEIQNGTFSSTNHIHLSHRSLDLETLKTNSKWNDAVRPPKLKRSLSDSKLQAHLLPKSKLPQLSSNTCPHSFDGHNAGDSSVKAEFLAKPLCNEHNELVADDVTDSKIFDGFASNVDATAKHFNPADCSLGGLEHVVGVLTDTKQPENILEISPVKESFSSDSPNADHHNKFNNPKINEKKRKKSRDNSTSRHKRRKHKRRRDRDSFDSDDNLYVWVEKTLETVQQEKNESDLTVGRSIADGKHTEKLGSKTENNLSIGRHNNRHNQECKDEFHLRASSSCPNTDHNSTQSRSTDLDRHVESVGQNRSRSRSSGHNRTSRHRSRRHSKSTRRDKNSYHNGCDRADRNKDSHIRLSVEGTIEQHIR